MWTYFLSNVAVRKFLVVSRIHKPAGLIFVPSVLSLNLFVTSRRYPYANSFHGNKEKTVLSYCMDFCPVRLFIFPYPRRTAWRARVFRPDEVAGSRMSLLVQRLFGARKSLYALRDVTSQGIRLIGLSGKNLDRILNASTFV